VLTKFSLKQKLSLSSIMNSVSSRRISMDSFTTSARRIVPSLPAPEPDQMSFMTWFRPRCRTVLRGVVLTVVAITLLAIFELNFIPVTQRGFFCDDQTIRYPHSPSTIPTWLLVILFIVIPDVALIIVELCFARSPVNLLYVMGHFKLSLCMTGILTDVIKCLVGRLRPHFIEACNPDVLVNMTCDSEAALKYITDYRCVSDKSSSILIDARKSFPSGHASLSMCSAVFIMCYTWRRAPSAPPHLGRLFLIFIFLASAGAVCGSRVMDYMHHPEDVAFGFLVGSVVALTSSYVWWTAVDSLEFPEPKKQKTVESGQEDDNSGTAYQDVL